MSKHDDLLEQGPRVAPEPETAEQRSGRRGKGAAAGGVAAGGLALAKLGVFGKIFLWLFAWRVVLDLWRFGGWTATAVAFVAVLAAVAVFVVRREA